VKETDRIAAVAQNLRAMGVTVEEFEDGMAITGGAKLRGATLPSFGDHRIAMSFAIAGLFASGETIIEDVECVATSYPGFEETLNRVRSGKALPRKSSIERGSVGSSIRRQRSENTL
jgi:3-phosphoshikimate 1-carboxyvinyltransferase